MFAAEAGGYAPGLDLVPDHYRQLMECTVSGGQQLIKTLRIL